MIPKRRARHPDRSKHGIAKMQFVFDLIWAGQQEADV